VIFIQCDILEVDKLNSIFGRFQPQFVFHTAAQRDPGLSEKQAELALKTNILGTLNTMQACEGVGTVKQVVFSSTGKASRYYTNEVYAASKKICEFIMSSFARKGTARYSMVRFTHILDNSLMDIGLRQMAYENDYVAVHSPGKYVTAQNIGEAADLMLNALVYSSDQQSNFLIVRNLEWPVESLEIALYYIKQSNRNIPIIFTGCPTGYIEKFFRGQLDWSMPQELNLLINVYENKRRTVNEAGDILISSIDPCSDEQLYSCIEKIRAARGDMESKNELLHALKVLVGDSFKNVDKEDTTRIIRWGTDPRHLELEESNLADFKDILTLLYDSLVVDNKPVNAESLPPDYIKKAEDVTYQ
jgi:FlaA1/EpsC-like NDP-sugar epimerase